MAIPLDEPLGKYERWDLRINTILALLTIGSLLVVFFGFRQTKEALQSSAGAAVYNHQREVINLLLGNPKLRPYFYDGATIPPNFYDGQTDKAKQDEYNEVLILSEQILDGFDLIIDQFPHFVREAGEGNGGWENYMRSMFNTSPSLCEYLDRYQAWYRDPQGNETDLIALARDAPSCGPRLDGLRPSGKPWPQS